MVSGLFQCTNKLFLSDHATGLQIKEFARKNAANALSVANMVMGMASILSSLNGWANTTLLDGNYLKNVRQAQQLQDGQSHSFFEVKNKKL